MADKCDWSYLFWSILIWHLKIKTVCVTGFLRPGPLGCENVDSARKFILNHEMVFSLGVGIGC